MTKEPENHHMYHRLFAYGITLHAHRSLTTLKTLNPTDQHIQVAAGFCRKRPQGVDCQLENWERVHTSVKKNVFKTVLAVFCIVLVKKEGE